MASRSGPALFFIFHETGPRLLPSILVYSIRPLSPFAFISSRSFLYSISRVIPFNTVTRRSLLYLAQLV
jgi:hypothetical protein